MRILNDKTFIVTGGAGFIGSNFVRYLIKNCPKAKIIIVDNLSFASNIHNLNNIPKNKYKFVKADINNTPLMKKIMAGADYVVNFAGETHVDRSIHQSSLTFLKSNVAGVRSLLEALQHSPNIKVFIHISTDEVFGDLPLNSAKKFNEKSPYRPNSPYSASKAAGDFFCRAYIKTFKLPIIIAYPSNNYGHFQLPEKLIPFFTLRAMKNLPLPIYGRGKQKREWLYVDDCSEAIFTLLQKGEAGESYCIGSGEELENLKITKMILSFLKKPESLIVFVEDRPGHDSRYSLNSSKIMKLGWKPKYTIYKQLASVIKWYSDNPKWVQKAISKKQKFNKHINLKSLKYEHKRGYFGRR